MKTFTRLFSLMVLATLSNVAFAQIDLSITGYSTVATASGEVPPETPITSLLSFENAGTADIPDQTPAIIFFLNGTDTIETNPVTFNGAFPAGGATVFGSGQFTLPGTPASINLCGGIVLTTLPETDSTNNVLCLPFTVSSSAQVDMKANSVSIVAPSNLDGFNIDNGENVVPEITEMSATFENAGNVIYPAGYAVAYRLGLDGDTINVTGGLAEALLPGSSTTRQITNTNIIPAVPQDSGTYEFCAILRENDENPANDKTCGTFTIIDQFDVNNPDNWPLGLEESDVKGIDVYVSNGNLNVIGVDGTTSVHITDMQGKIITSKQINRNTTFNVDGATGVYIVTTRDANNAIVISKVVL
jgi:hypothetical protein